MLHRSIAAWRVRCWRAPALRAQAVSKNPSKCLIAPQRSVATNARVSSSSCGDVILGSMVRTGAPRHYRHLGNEPPTTFHCCRCASPSGAMSLHPRRSNRVIAIHRPARSKQCWARARDRTFQDTLRRHQSRRIQGCNAAGNRGGIGQHGAAGTAHTRPRGKISLIAVWTLGSSDAGGIITPPPTGPSRPTA